MITGVHTISFSPEAEKVRAFFADVLGLPSVDAGGGWLIFAMPPAELAVHPADGDHIRHGHIYVAPPDRHLIVEQGRIRTPRGPKENGFRPAIDPLFRSAAHTYGPQAVGVILSGGLDDGTLGLRVLKAAGGVAVVLDPDDAPIRKTIAQNR